MDTPHVSSFVKTTCGDLPARSHHSPRTVVGRAIVVAATAPLLSAGPPAARQREDGSAALKKPPNSRLVPGAGSSFRVSVPTSKGSPSAIAGRFLVSSGPSPANEGLQKPGRNFRLPVLEQPGLFAC